MLYKDKDPTKRTVSGIHTCPGPLDRILGVWPSRHYWSLLGATRKPKSVFKSMKAESAIQDERGS